MLLVVEKDFLKGREFGVKIRKERPIFFVCHAIRITHVVAVPFPSSENQTP